jgi:hypothetical protein
MDAKSELMFKSEINRLKSKKFSGFRLSTEAAKQKTAVRKHFY